MIQVRLKEWQKLQAVLAGTQRHKIYKKNQWQSSQHIHKTQKTNDESEVKRHILAVGAEIAVHQYWGLIWEHKPYPLADVGQNVEVRHSPTARDLPIRIKDNNSHWAVLVYGDLDLYQIPGYINIGYAKKTYVGRQGPQSWDKYWMIPPEILMPIDHLHMLNDIAYEIIDVSYGG